MYKLGIFIALFLISFTLSSQSTKAEYKPENEGWLVDLDQAYSISKKTGKPILANFTGSDWCGWCKRLTRDVFSKQDFKSWAADNVILLELDFPRRKSLPQDLRSQNAGLQRAFKVRGYPTIWVFDIDKDPGTGQYQIDALGKTGYTKTVAEFTAGINKMIDKRNTAGTN